MSLPHYYITSSHDQLIGVNISNCKLIVSNNKQTLEVSLLPSWIHQLFELSWSQYPFWSNVHSRIFPWSRGSADGMPLLIVCHNKFIMNYGIIYDFLGLRN